MASKNTQSIRSTLNVPDNVILAPHGFPPELANGILSMVEAGFSIAQAADQFVMDEVVARLMIKRRVCGRQPRKGVSNV